MDKGILKASRTVWNDPAFHKARLALKEHIKVIREEYNQHEYIEEPRGSYTLYCESDLFHENKYGPHHQYIATFTQHPDETITVEIIP